jgi:mono/diheme cytochrome c family protein
VLVGLTAGQKLGLVIVAAVFIGFALLSAFVLPRRNPDFPGPRGLRWFIVVTVLLLASMLTAMAVLAREEEEGGEAVATETEPGETEPAETEPGETEPAETEPAETEPAEGDPAAGKQVFEEAGCGSCHTLADAGTAGSIGPNLDEAKPPSDLVVERVTEGMGQMPSFADQLSEEQIANVAAYVVQATGG